LECWGGVDASTKRDSTAIVLCAWDHTTKRAGLVFHKIFQPSPEDPLDFETTIEATLIDLRMRFNLKKIFYDPYQMAASAQRLQKAAVPMEEFPQTVANLTAASSNLYELIKGGNLLVYPDADIRLAISRAIALETSRGWRITKEKTAHKIDVVVALAQAALGATTEGQTSLNAQEWTNFGVGLGAWNQHWNDIWRREGRLQ
jgi:phage terminase large subunit-like protein